ncbi:hypothetical protein [Myxacorys almedinensis]|uniref:Uncharacterized protein n=1 Tax=Myxacorys almedinensis A TaxID=2690445 RepID=A0A8J7YZD0_9CYAN|nr:hypothetical protein [Myxacorys almedinensis]NDJ17367.1 hypothetical protein [Myxacorys almedinensis A]
MNNLVKLLNSFGYNTVLLWGCEYWYWHQKNGRSHRWQAVQHLIEA